ncbi:hypothetical protein CPB83DRAFT_897844 [Crepidotus variabilis]|uniref:Uncharacterized protein n=1 Tax=Crepidotus variabilis TaxID=179855 RepID=A0A9P6JKR0_9AGAR|nr:hypothetical protein CPB83DRAFT_897844 [Crepidotus variabilis]
MPTNPAKKKNPTTMKPPPKTKPPADTLTWEDLLVKIAHFEAAVQKTGSKRVTPNAVYLADLIAEKKKRETAKGYHSVPENINALSQSPVDGSSTQAISVATPHEVSESLEDEVNDVSVSHSQQMGIMGPSPTDTVAPTSLDTSLDGVVRSNIGVVTINMTPIRPYNPRCSSPLTTISTASSSIPLNINNPEDPLSDLMMGVTATSQYATATTNSFADFHEGVPKGSPIASSEAANLSLLANTVDVMLSKEPQPDATEMDQTPDGSAMDQTPDGQDSLHQKKRSSIAAATKKFHHQSRVPKGGAMIANPGQLTTGHMDNLSGDQTSSRHAVPVTSAGSRRQSRHQSPAQFSVHASEHQHALKSTLPGGVNSLGHADEVSHLGPVTLAGSRNQPPAQPSAHVSEYQYALKSTPPEGVNSLIHEETALHLGSDQAPLQPSPNIEGGIVNVHQESAWHANAHNQDEVMSQGQQSAWPNASQDLHGPVVHLRDHEANWQGNNLNLLGAHLGSGDGSDSLMQSPTADDQSDHRFSNINNYANDHTAWSMPDMFPQPQQVSYDKGSHKAGPGLTSPSANDHSFGHHSQSNHRLTFSPQRTSNPDHGMQHAHVDKAHGYLLDPSMRPDPLVLDYPTLITMDQDFVGPNENTLQQLPWIEAQVQYLTVKTRMLRAYHRLKQTPPDGLDYQQIQQETVDAKKELEGLADTIRELNPPPPKVKSGGKKKRTTKKRARKTKKGKGRQNDEEFSEDSATSDGATEPSDAEDGGPKLRSKSLKSRGSHYKPVIDRSDYKFQNNKDPLDKLSDEDYKAWENNARKELNLFIATLTGNTKNANGFTHGAEVVINPSFLVEAATTHRLISLKCLTNQNGYSSCRAHMRGSAGRTKKVPDCDSGLELVGIGYAAKPKTKQTGQSEFETPAPGHLHCGCSIESAILDLYLSKTTPIGSTNPDYDYRQYYRGPPPKGGHREMWLTSFKNYTGLDLNDLLVPGYGTPEYEGRLAVTQLYVQARRAQMLGIPVQVVIRPKSTNPTTSSIPSPANPTSSSNVADPPNASQVVLESYAKETMSQPDDWGHFLQHLATTKVVVPRDPGIIRHYED